MSEKRWSEEGASNFELQVHKFKAVQGQSAPYSKVFVNNDNTYVKSNDVQRVLAARLMLEELLETIEAMGLTVTIGDNKVTVDSLKSGDVSIDETSANDIVLSEVVDGLADLYYTTVWSAAEFTVPLQPYADIVAISNLTKFGPGWYKDEHGKVIKSPSYTPADDIIRAILLSNTKK